MTTAIMRFGNVVEQPKESRKNICVTLPHPVPTVQIKMHVHKRKDQTSYIAALWLSPEGVPYLIHHLRSRRLSPAFARFMNSLSAHT